MKVTFKDATLLRDVITALCQVNDTVYIIPEDNRIRFWTIDNTMALLIQVTLNEADFSDYEKGDLELMPIALNDLKKIMSKVRSGDAVTLEFLPSNQVCVRVGGRYPLKIKMPLRIEELPYVEVTSLDYDTTVVLYGVLLNDILKIMKDFTAELRITALPEKIIFKAISKEYELESELDPQNDFVKAYETVNGAKAVYSVAYLLSIMRGIKPNDLVTIEFGSDMPMHIRRPAGNDSEMEWWLAPRVEDEG